MEGSCAGSGYGLTLFRARAEPSSLLYGYIHDEYVCPPENQGFRAGSGIFGLIVWRWYIHVFRVCFELVFIGFMGV